MACSLLLEVGWNGVARTMLTRDLKGEAHADDSVRIDVRLLPLLGDGRMREILRGVLVRQGWVSTPEGGLEKAFGEAVAVFDPETLVVVLSARASVEVSARGSAVSSGDAGAADEAALVQATKALAAKELAESQRLASQVTQSLIRDEPGLRSALQEALNRTYREALEERARQMGEVEGVVEQGDVRGGYEVTVVVMA